MEEKFTEARELTTDTEKRATIIRGQARCPLTMNYYEPLPYKRNIWIPKMTVSRLERILSHGWDLTDDEKEDLLDFMYFLLTDKVSATEKGFYEVMLDGRSYFDPGALSLKIKDWSWIPNIMYLKEGFESKYNLPPEPGIWQPPDSSALERKPPARRKRAPKQPLQRRLIE
jgi:hypothetical protein